MKFHCPKCRKQFLLSAKLAGKTIKVRCTSCGSVFRMRVTAGQEEDRETAEAPATEPAGTAAQPAPAPHEPTRSESPAQDAIEPTPSPAPDADARTPARGASKLAGRPMDEPAAEVANVAAQAAAAAARAAVEVQSAPVEVGHRYFSVVAGKRLGPMPHAALKRLIQEQKIHGDTLVWRKGLDEWLEASRLAELAPLFSGAGLLAPQPAAVPPPLPPQVVSAHSPAEQPAATRPARAKAGKAAPVRIDETTGEEVHIEEMDQQFFALGQMQQPSMRGSEEIQLAEPMFPHEIEEHGVEKGAKASLKDFSVMVRMSKRSRTKNVTVLVGIFSATALAVALIFTLGDPLGAIFPEKQIAEEKRSGPSGYFTTVEKKEPKDRKAGKAKTRDNQQPVEAGEDPAKLLRDMQDKEWHVSVGDECLDVDRGQLRDKLKHKEPSKSSGSGGPSKSKTGNLAIGAEDDPEELSLEEYARRVETRQKDGSLVIAPGGKNHIADSMDSAMGGLSGGPKRIEEKKVTATVKERESDGVALKAVVARRVGQKVKGERKNMQRCVDSASGGYAGSDGRITATLHFSEQGKVERVSVPGAPAELEQCFTRIFDGWGIAMVTQKVKVPIAIRFE